MVNLIFFPLTRCFCITHNSCKGEFWGRGQSHTPKWFPMYGDSKNIIAKIILSSIAEFLKLLKIASIFRLGWVLAKLSNLLSNWPKPFFVWKAYACRSHWCKNIFAVTSSLNVMLFVYFCKQMAINHPRPAPILMNSISNERSIP